VGFAVGGGAGGGRRRAVGRLLLVGGTCAAPLGPRALLRARSFRTAAAVYLLALGGLSGALFWVTLYYQDVAGWSVLRTGLSWLFMNVPYLLTAQFGGRLDARVRTVYVVVTGTVVATVGVFLLSLAGADGPFTVSALGYLLYGAGFGTFVPATTHAAMRDVPAGVSGAASGVLNAARQIGSALCLAVLGTAGVNAAESSWRSAAGRAGGGPRALAQAQNVGDGRCARWSTRSVRGTRHSSSTPSCTAIGSRSV
jgi:predicted MFS family arabinose efflux permease